MAAGGSIEQARTVVVNSFVLFEIAYLFNCRQLSAPSLGRDAFFGNRVALLSIAAVLLLQAGFTYLGFMNALFGSAPLSFTDWTLAGILAVLLFAIVEAEKWIVRVVERRRGKMGVYERRDDGAFYNVASTPPLPRHLLK